ncbi:hypothetical protein [Corynebacterium sp.]|nr:hypothetical protein [Corynebacterium sp.]
MNIVADYLRFLSSMGGFLSSLALSLLGIPQCGLHDTRGCVHE